MNKRYHVRCIRPARATAMADQQTAENAGGLMQGKRGLIMGVANDHSIAWGIANTLAQHGAKLALPIKATHWPNG